jgi:hypothetical protein
VAFVDGYVAVTNDSGKTWNPLKPDPPFFRISGVAVTARRKLVVVGNGSVHTLDLATVD